MHWILFFCSYYLCDFMSEASLNFFLYEFCEISSYQTSFLFPLFSVLRKMTLRTKAIKKSFLGVAYLLFPFFPNFLKTFFVCLLACLLAHIILCVVKKLHQAKSLHICKSCSELFLLLQFTIYPFGPPQSYNFKKLKTTGLKHQFCLI